MKISKPAAKLHKKAMALVRSGRRLTLDERDFVITNFHEGAEHMNGLAGAFFTPQGLARDLAIEAGSAPRRILDLCAGIGALSYACERDGVSFVCVETNAAYCEVGRAVMPDATWINASAFDVAAYAHLGPFDMVIGNPPFGRVPADGFAGNYTGGAFEYRLIETASRVAKHGVFIVPQQSAPFRCSGRRCYSVDRSAAYNAFHEQTGIELDHNCGIDTSIYRWEWRGAAPQVEIILCDFTGAPS